MDGAVFARPAEGAGRTAVTDADRQIMLEQLVIMYDCRDLVESAKRRKLARLARRLKGGA